MRRRAHDAERRAEQKCDDAGAERGQHRPAEAHEQRGDHVCRPSAEISKNIFQFQL
jgi:hypothetical protein